MRISLIVAMGPDRLIGKDGDLPWRLPADLKRFKALTLGKPILMGRKTWDSLGRPLPGRPNLVLTRDPAFAPEGAQVAHDVAEALDLAGRRAAEWDVDEVMVIGGAQVYALFLPRATRLYLTEVHGAFDGDTVFPEWCEGDWRECQRVECAADDKNAWPHTYRLLERAAGPGAP